MPDTTTRRSITQPKADRSDSADVALWIRNIAAAVDADVVFVESTAASRGAASLSGRIHHATDTDELSFDKGSSWIAVGSAQIPIGAVLDWPWASGDIPAWTALPYGQALAAAGLTVLAALDTNAGNPHGVSAGNIVLPDYRGRVGGGKDNMGGSAANRITAAISGTAGTVLGAVIGNEGVTLTTAQLPAHNHGVNDPTHRHGITDATANNGGHDYPAGNGSPGGSNFFADCIHYAATGITIQNAGSGSAHLNVQPTIIVNKIMRIT